MKKQYLGDAKDSFKWDYHNYLTVRLRCRLLQAVLLLTPDDRSSDGGTEPKKFRAKEESIWKFCDHLREVRHAIADDEIPQLLGELPRYARTRSKYKVTVDLGCVPSNKKTSRVIFFDPDTGFEPDGGANESHVRYCEITAALRDISSHPDSIVSVYQNSRRKEFKKDYEEIKERLQKQLLEEKGDAVDLLPKQCYSTAIYWNGSGRGGAMFVILAKSQERIGDVCDINVKYRDCIHERGGVVKLLDNNAA